MPRGAIRMRVPAPALGPKQSSREIMHTKKILVAGIATAIVMALAGPAIMASRKAQDNRAQAPTIRNTVELVVVPVTVKDGKGQLVSDLRRDEFRVLEDGVEQRISLFSVDPFPLSAVVAFDGDLKA